MKKIAFIGSYDKTDLLLYIAKILTVLGKKVLLVDTTLTQKSRYVVPSMKNLKQSITTFEQIDVAVGFESFEMIQKYQSMNGEASEYDFILLDIDSSRGYEGYQVANTDKHYFVTSFDMYNLKRGLQVFRKLTTPVNVTKLLFSKEMLQEEDDYLNYLSSNLKINWNSEIIYFPFELGDQNVIYANQRTGRIRLKGLSTEYTDSVMYIAEEISGQSSNDIKKAVKIIEKNS